MNAARMLKYARRRAGLTQRGLAAAAGVPHSTVARIELGQLSPRVDTLGRLLAATGHTLEIDRAAGAGVDRTQIRELLRLSPVQRARLAITDAANLAQLKAARRR